MTLDLLENQALVLHAASAFSWLVWLVTAVIVGLELRENYQLHRWAPAYFRSGLPLFTRRYTITGQEPLAHRLQNVMYGINEITATTYHVINQETCLFRHQSTGFFWREAWQLHGYIRYLPTENAIQVHGFTRGSITIVLLILLTWLLAAQTTTSFQADAWQQWLYVATVIGSILWWFRQRRICDRIGRTLAEGN